MAVIVEEVVYGGGVSFIFEKVSVWCGGERVDVPNIHYLDNRENRLTPCQAYQHLLNNTYADALVYIHDDVIIHDSTWHEKLFPLMVDNPNCVAVGLGGATALGSPDLYRTPYDIWQMARRGYASNQTDAEIHGERFTGARRVAVLDAFFMAVRTDWLRTRMTRQPLVEWDDKDHFSDPVTETCDLGWPVSRLTHHGLDMWLACEAARDKKEIWQVGVSCTHHGGGTSTKSTYADAKWLQGGSRERDHEIPHLWLYKEYRDVLPIVVSA